MISTQLTQTELTEELYQLFETQSFDDVYQALEDAFHRRASDSFDNRWSTTGEELQDLRRRNFDITDPGFEDLPLFLGEFDSDFDAEMDLLTGQDTTLLLEAA